ncbi:MAG: BatA domain-containing protein [Planctomycetia bacterium]
MGLTFFTPLLLGGAALVAVPVVLHMIMRRKPVPHDFPALRFLREKAVATRRRLRLNHILLLLLRMAALVLLSLALARPVLRGANWLADGEGEVTAVFVFDTAPRMMLREANRTRLDQAKAMAKVLFGKLPPSSQVAVLDTAGGPAAFSPTEAAAVARMEKLTAATPAVALPAVIADAVRLLTTDAKFCVAAAPTSTKSEDGASAALSDSSGAALSQAPREQSVNT